MTMDPTVQVPGTPTKATEAAETASPTSSAVADTTASTAGMVDEIIAATLKKHERAICALDGFLTRIEKTMATDEATRTENETNAIDRLPELHMYITDSMGLAASHIQDAPTQEEAAEWTRIQSGYETLLSRLNDTILPKLPEAERAAVLGHGADADDVYATTVFVAEKVSARPSSRRRQA